MHPYSLSRRAALMRASEIRELLKLLDKPGMTSFAGGIPDPSLFDLAAFRNSYELALADTAAGAASLQYSATEGYAPLRQWIAGYMAARGVACTEDHVLVTHGSQQALDLIGKPALDPGDTLLTTFPTYLGALQSFSAFEPSFARIVFDEGEASAEVTAAKLLYLVPDFANPTGETLGLAARQAALALADRLNAIVVEDGAYADLRYDGAEIEPIAAIDQARMGSIDETRTLYCGTFSKTLSPSLRVGWICGPVSLIRRLTLIKQAADLHTSTINQRVIHQVAVGTFETQVIKARAAYRARRDIMLRALGEAAPPGLVWTRPEGGLFIWVTLPSRLEAAELLKRALAKDVAFVPGGAFFPDGSGGNTLRLSFSLADLAATEAGIAQLCNIFADAVPRRRAAGRRRRGF